MTDDFLPEFYRQEFPFVKEITAEEKAKIVAEFGETYKRAYASLKSDWDEAVRECMTRPKDD